ncbi:MAG: TMEM165/GDT1 family protein [Gammaproteobacteria bacterium]|nr:TMEM165/GDT1 family protein [Gammaproteobacteria bacterium]
MLEYFYSFFTALLLIFAAEFADKSQLVCMTLSAKHRAWPVFIGAALAFLLLNGIAVLFGTVAIQWLPEWLVTAAVALLFLVFGLQSLIYPADDESLENQSIHYSSIILSTFLLISVAEFGDKTQLAVIGLSTQFNPWLVYLGSSLALVLTSGLGVWAGQKLLQIVSIKRVHQVSGIIFIVLGAFSTYELIQVILINPS